MSFSAFLPPSGGIEGGLERYLNGSLLAVGEGSGNNASAVEASGHLDNVTLGEACYGAALEVVDHNVGALVAEDEFVETVADGEGAADGLDAVDAGSVRVAEDEHGDSVVTTVGPSDAAFGEFGLTGAADSATVGFLNEVDILVLVENF